MKRLMIMLLLAVPMLASAQCSFTNTAFGDRESLYYNLHFNWKFVWFKVGTAAMITTKTEYEDQPAYNAYLITRSNKKLDRFFVLRDTLLSYTTTDLVPLYFRKGAHEGDRYYVDEIWYSYPNGDCKLKKHRIDADGEEHWTNTTYKECIYDMMSIFLRARNFDAAKFKVGDIIPMPISDARRLSETWLVYKGKKKFTMDDTKEKFNCLVFSFYEREDGEDNELLRFYVTDDANHIPVRIDMFLKFGSAKAFLSGYKGIRNPMTSKIVDD